MKYSNSQLDKYNFEWFANDVTVASLTELELKEGNLRGLSPFHIEFKYPIAVIAGKNKSGKSTILAMVSCAYHNSKEGFKTAERKLPYYTFSDFLIQISEEIPPEGIKISYRIRHNNWNKSQRAPKGIGNLWQVREKRQGGKWNKYARRVRRNVVFLGIQRVVPHSEKSVYRNYKSLFSQGAPDGWENQVKEAVGRILGTSYDSFWTKTYGIYRMPLVASKGTIYSGFNMGAGENTLFEIFSIIYATPKGTLLVIDEIELGLHENAQKRLIKELKKVCHERHVQIICTTHSPAIIREIPPEARFYIENYIGKTSISCGVTAEYASGKLSGEKTNELDIYVEDVVSCTIIKSILSSDIRQRVSIIPIGSAKAISRHMAGRYKDKRRSECIAIMDGDQGDLLKDHQNEFTRAIESNIDNKKDVDWFVQRLTFLPGKIWPERWIFLMLRNSDIVELSKSFQIGEKELKSIIEESLSAEKHNEIYTLSKNLSLDIDSVCNTIANWIAINKYDEVKYLVNFIVAFLDG